MAIRKTHKAAKAEGGNASKAADAKGWSTTKMVGAALAIIAVIIIVGVIIFMPQQQAKTTTTSISTTIPPYTILGGLTQQQVLSRLDSYPQQGNFTATYSGTIDMALPSPYGTINGTVSSLFERYGASALSKTAVVLPSVNQSFNTSQYYASNGTVYTCTSNSTNILFCRGAYSSIINASNFALYFLVSNSTTGGLIGLSNSSYNGVSCLMANGGFNTSTNSSGVIVTNLARFSGCIEPRYRVPLFLNLTTITTISGSYYNGTATTQVTPESEQVFIQLHLSNLTNSSSASEVENFPANAIVTSG